MKYRLGISIAMLLAVGGICDCYALTGKWRGNISMGLTKLPLVFNFGEGADGVTTATMDSPQQNAKGIPLDGTKDRRLMPRKTLKYSEGMSERLTSDKWMV